MFLNLLGNIFASRLCFSGSKFCFRNNVSTGGQTGKHLRKHRESQLFPQQCFLVCPGLKGINGEFVLAQDNSARVENSCIECHFQL